MKEENVVDIGLGVVAREMTMIGAPLVILKTLVLLAEVKGKGIAGRAEVIMIWPSVMMPIVEDVDEVLPMMMQRGEGCRYLQATSLTDN